MKKAIKKVAVQLTNNEPENENENNKEYEILNEIKKFLNIDEDDDTLKVRFRNVGNNKYRVNVYQNYYSDNSIKLSKIKKSYYLCNENGLKDITR